ncbi:hypothetical protein E2C01_055254 [Portunus trituberculatus]|uniref:HTH psq-type domain-containing protein n=1 Tax=Portunus trituberculatus TaxID=210409 RepID=A0A5B7GWB7_PORTR|nr:hypothetical protein [Portunus trituberculatus]
MHLTSPPKHLGLAPGLAVARYLPPLALSLLCCCYVQIWLPCALHFILAMTPKLPTPSTPSAAKKRKVLSLAQKMEVIESVKGGLGWTEAAKKFGLHEASVCTIYKTRDKIRQSVH